MPATRSKVIISVQLIMTDDPDRDCKLSDEDKKRTEDAKRAAAEYAKVLRHFIERLRKMFD